MIINCNNCENLVLNKCIISKLDIDQITDQICNKYIPNYNKIPDDETIDVMTEYLDNSKLN